MTTPPWLLNGGTPFSLAAGATIRHLYWYWTTDPSGRQVGDFKGPQLALPVPEQLLTSSGHVQATGQGFVVGDLDIQYTVDVACDGGGEDASYTVWAGGVL
jgi:hypothetical protein